MSTVADNIHRGDSRGIGMWPLIWVGALALVLVLHYGRELFPAAVQYPADSVIPFAEWISALMAWLRENFTWFTRSITATLNVPLSFALDLLAKGFKFGHGAEAWTL
ncbi:MAG: ABC transporter permease, partial [Pseudomonadota bacterium]